MSYFVANNCKLDGDTIINLVSWSNVDPIAALSTVTTDEKERKIHKVQFMNNEVIINIFVLLAPLIAISQI